MRNSATSVIHLKAKSIASSPLGPSFFNSVHEKPKMHSHCSVFDSLNIVTMEQGTLENIGRLEIIRGITGNMVLMHIGRQLPGSVINLQFRVSSKLELQNDNDDGDVEAKCSIYPFEMVPWAKINVATLPSYLEFARLTVFANTNPTMPPDFNTIVDITAGFTDKVVSENGATFTLGPNALGRIPPKRSLRLDVFLSLALKELSLDCVNSAVFVKLYRKGNVIHARYLVDFNATISVGMLGEYEKYDTSIVSYLHVSDGPLYKVELRQNSRYLADCDVRLNPDETASTVRLQVPYNGDSTFDSLQLVFERTYTTTVAALYIPKIIAPNGTSTVSLYDQIGCEVCAAPGLKPVNIGQGEYRATSLDSKMVLLPPPDTTAIASTTCTSVREISYKFNHRPESSNIVKVELQMYVVVDISEAIIGQCILQVHTSDFWLRPNLVQVDGQLANTEEYFYDNCSKVTVFKRHQSQKRDLEVKFTWVKRTLRHDKYIFNENIPYLSQEVENVKFVVKTKVDDGYVQCGVTKHPLKDQKMVCRFASGDPIWVVLAKGTLSSAEKIDDVGPVGANASAKASSSGHAWNVAIHYGAVIVTTALVVLIVVLLFTDASLGWYPRFICPTSRQLSEARERIKLLENQLNSLS